MNRKSIIIVFGILVFLLFDAVASGVASRTVDASTQKTVVVQFNNIGGGLTSLTNETSHTSLYAAKLMIPSNASQGSGCMALYPYNKTLNSLQSFQIYTSYINATPRFVILIDTDNDGSTDVFLLSDYQFLSDGNWQTTQGGQRWGWTQASPSLGIYGQTWNVSSYWKGIYGNATVLYVGIALEYWAVKDSNGLDQPLYADELVLNGMTYSIVPASNGITLDNWSMFHHDVQHTGTSKSAASNNNLLWQFSTGDKIRSSAAVVNGIVYDGSNNGYVYAFNATNGYVIWQYKSGSNVELSPTVVDGVVYIGILWDGHNGYVCALNADDGTVIWRYATNSGIESSPAVVNGVVYIGSYCGYIYALNTTNGALIWSYLTGGPVFSSPAVSGSIIYVGSRDGYVYALNAIDGSIMWSFRTGGIVYSSPAVVDNIVYVGSQDRNVYALNASDGTVVWCYTTSGYLDPSPAVAAGVVYVNSGDGYLYALNATNGSLIWASNAGYGVYNGYVYSSPAVAGAFVYVGSHDGYVLALHASDGAIAWSYCTGAFIFSSPAVANGVIYIGGFDGKIYALGTIFASTPTSTSTQVSELTSISTSESESTLTASPIPDSTSELTIISDDETNSLFAQTQFQEPTPTPRPQPETNLMNPFEPKATESINWLILGSVTSVQIIAVISLVLFFKRRS